MNGTHILLILTHLFRKRGSKVSIDNAVEYLSFELRYGSPSNIRRMLTIALENEMITLSDGEIAPNFLYDRQILSPNQSAYLLDRVEIEDTIECLR
ncbi:MAG: DUF2240 family protein [Candidatus Thorarchaeota archaeon]|jgi:hypothetical protein